MPNFDPEKLSNQHARLRRLAAAIVGDGLADDVVQETWMAALAVDGREPAHWAAWLSRVTRNLAWRRRLGDDRRRAREASTARGELHSSTDELIAQIEEGHLVERSLTQLDEPYRSTLLWRFYEDLSIAEISRRTGHPESTTRTHLQRGLAKLRERLKSERGPDWRAALVPLLRVEPKQVLASASGSVAGLGGIWMATLWKPALVVALLVSAWMWSESWREPPENEEAESALVAERVPKPAEPAKALPVEGQRDDEVRFAEAPKSVAKAAPVANAESTAGLRVRVLDPRSERGLSHALVDVKHGERHERLRADGEGWIELPFETTEEERSAARPFISAEALVPQGDRDFPVICELLGSEGDGGYSLRPTGGWAVEVRLPDGVENPVLDQLGAALTYKLSSGRAMATPQRYQPLHRAHRQLTFFLPSLMLHNEGYEELAGFSLLLTDASGEHNFRVVLPPEANLAAGPYRAEAVELVTQRLRIVESTSAEPVPGVFVSIRAAGRPNARPLEWANGLTDVEGRVALRGVPAGPQLVLFSKQGFEFQQVEIEVRGGPEELQLGLKEIAGKSDVEVNITAKGGLVPEQIALTALRAKNVEGFLWLHPEPREGGGWSASATLESLPPGEYEFTVSSEVPGLGTSKPRLVEVPCIALHIELDAPGPTRPLRLRLPESVRQADFWIESDGVLRMVARFARDDSQVAIVAESGEPRAWMVHSPGHVPVLGGRDAWKSTRDEHDHQRIFEVRPALEEGWGILLQVYGPEGVLPGASLSDPATGLVVGTSDELGLALIRATEPLERIAVTLGETRQKELRTSAEPFLRCYLPK